jgi:hypothetical protein
MTAITLLHWRGTGIRPGLNVSAFASPGVHRLARLIANRRVADAQVRDEADGFKLLRDHQPPWAFHFGERRLAYQTRRAYDLVGLLASPEWLLAVTCREMALRRTGFFEYRLTQSNDACSLLPAHAMRQVDYLWWRLETYVGIKRNEWMFTDELLTAALDWAAAFFAPLPLASTRK